MAKRDLYSELGPAALRAVIVDFYERVFADPMIGFLFEGKSKVRLVEKEFEFTAHFLGGPVAYTGKPMKQAHAQSPILGGHFERRLQILKDTLAAHQVPAEVSDAWLSHQLVLRSQVTPDRGSECATTAVKLDGPGVEPPALVTLGRARRVDGTDQRGNQHHQPAAEPAAKAGVAPTGES